VMEVTLLVTFVAIITGDAVAMVTVVSCSNGDGMATVQWLQRREW
jgi:hypothetical protein